MRKLLQFFSDAIDTISAVAMVIGALVVSVILLAIIFSPVWIPFWFGYKIIELLTLLIEKI